MNVADRSLYPTRPSVSVVRHAHALLSPNFWSGSLCASRTGASALRLIRSILNELAAGGIDIGAHAVADGGVDAGSPEAFGEPIAMFAR